MHLNLHFACSFYFQTGINILPVFFVRMRWTSGSSQNLVEHSWLVQSNGRVIDVLENMMIALENNRRRLQNKPL